jgi:hypothetical protein
MMYNPSDKWKRPLSELEQTWAFDSASARKGFLTRPFERAEKEHREFKLSGIDAYPRMPLILK